MPGVYGWAADGYPFVMETTKEAGKSGSRQQHSSVIAYELLLTTVNFRFLSIENCTLRIGGAPSFPGAWRLQ